ncbi:MAG: IPT/TIG domain-containing protein [Bacteroides intestinalis]|nr:IPT/TIG domain-containing protein [Bacteroides intestinalis]
MLSNMTLTSCSDGDVANANDVLMVNAVLPTKVMEGQVVTITGTGLEKTISVVFPGNVSVNNITKIGNGYISVITPAGVSAEGGDSNNRSQRRIGRVSHDADCRQARAFARGSS